MREDKFYFLDFSCLKFDSPCENITIPISRKVRNGIKEGTTLATLTTTDDEPYVYCTLIWPLSKIVDHEISW